MDQVDGTPKPHGEAPTSNNLATIQICATGRCFTADEVAAILAGLLLVLPEDFKSGDFYKMMVRVHHAGYPRPDLATWWNEFTEWWKHERVGKYREGFGAK